MNDIVLQEIKNYSNSHNIKKVIAGVSGGSDSICMLSLIKKAGLEVTALHCNFNLRGEESVRDRNFVDKICKSANIPLEIIEFDVKQYLVANKGVSLEMACRKLRHDWFAEKKIEFLADRIVLGHNADDNIETFFLNLLRGSGTSGLKGMEYDNGVIWRPLLNFHKETILGYLERNNLSYVTDSTNLLSDYRRNFLRNEVIPLLKKEWKGFNKCLDKTIKNLESENKIVKNSLDHILNTYKDKLPLEEIKAFPAPELLVRTFLSPLKPFSTTASEVLDAIRAEKPHSPKWNLPGGSAFFKKGSLHRVIKIEEEGH